jgi:hypothetical protein
MRGAGQSGFLIQLAALLASRTDLAPQVTAGVTTGPGNQGSANTAHLVGQAGTSGAQISLPRSQHFGAGGFVGGSNP